MSHPSLPALPIQDDWGTWRRPLPDNQPQAVAAFIEQNESLTRNFLMTLAGLGLLFALVLLIANVILNQQWLLGILGTLNVLAMLILWVGLKRSIPPIPLFAFTQTTVLVTTAIMSLIIADLPRHLIIIVFFNSFTQVVPWPPRTVRALLGSGLLIHLLLHVATIYLQGGMVVLQLFLLVFAIGSFVVAIIFHGTLLNQRWQNFVARMNIQNLNQTLVQRTAALEEANKELAAQNSDLDAFAHSVAHDLKTPLGIMYGYTGLLLEMTEDIPPDVAEMQALLTRIERTSLNAADIVQELLLLARVRREPVERQSIEMDVVVAVAMERVAKLVEEVEAQVVIPSTWPTAVGYAPWLVEVWVNYLTNAIKYGGRPCLITLGYDKPKEGQIRFWVEDNGRGLTTTQQAQLFTEFNRLGAEQQQVEGHGLGLTIVARIMDKLHGSAGAESEFGAGSRFYFCLPTT